MAACVDGRSPTGPDLSATLTLSLAPRFAVVPAAAEVARLGTARVAATDATTGEVLASIETVIDPDASEWFFDLTVELPSGKARQVVVTVELLSDVVEWSGRAAPVSLVVGATQTELKSIQLLRGPLDNLSVTAVHLLDVPGTLPEGVRGQAATTVAGGGQGARVFYRSLSPDILEVSREGSFRTLAPGTGMVEARAGAAADTAVVAIQAIPVEDGAVETVAGGVGDSVDRLVPGLQDGAGAASIVQSLSAFQTAVATRRAAQILDAVESARQALASYGDAQTRYQDGPELSLIELVLDYTEGVVLAGLRSLSNNR